MNENNNKTYYAVSTTDLFKCGVCVATATLCSLLALKESVKQRRRASKAEKEALKYKTAVDLDWIVIEGQRKEYEEEIERLEEELKLAKHSGRYKFED